MSIYCLREYGDLGEVIETGVMPDIPDVERPTEEELDNDPH
jgi:hypothetical protein